MKLVFWLSAGLLVYTQAGYGLLLAVLARLRGAGLGGQTPQSGLPSVSLVIAAYAEEAVIADKVANARALDYPRDRLEVVVACDGSPDATPQRAREAGADVVLELPHGGKIRAQDAAVERSRSDIVAFSDANAIWEPDALRELVAPFAQPDVGYVCGQVRFVNDEGTNQEGLYWRYELWLRSMESRLASVTGGNGAIYATRRADYLVVDPVMGHDLSFPFNMVKRGRRAVYAPRARATEKMVPTIEGEFARKRRMMIGLPDIVIADRMWDLRGYGPLYAYEILSHRLLRYASPLLHLALLVANLLLLRRGRIYRLALAKQLALLAAAAIGDAAPGPFRKLTRIARYYVLVTASIGLGFWDRRRNGPPAAWEKSEGTR